MDREIDGAFVIETTGVPEGFEPPTAALIINAAETRDERQGALAEAKRDALLEAVKEAAERGDIGRPGEIEVWDWLRNRAAHLSGDTAVESDAEGCVICGASIEPRDSGLCAAHEYDEQRGRRREDATPSGVTALRMAAGNMPLSRPGQPWEGAAQWLLRRADAIETRGTPPQGDPVSEPWCCDFCPALATRIVGDIGGTLACDEHAKAFLDD